MLKGIGVKQETSRPKIQKIEKIGDGQREDTISVEEMKLIMKRMKIK